MKLTIDDLKTKTLIEVKRLYAAGHIDKTTAAAYCELWNNSTFRFTHAKVVGQTIMQFDAATRPAMR